MKKKIIGMTAVGLASLFLLGGTLASTQADGPKVQQQMDTKHLTISLTGTGSTQTGNIMLNDALPGGVYGPENGMQTLQIQNDGNTALYTRVTVHKSWGSLEGNAFIQDAGLDASAVTVSGDGKWLMGTVGTDGKTISLHYRTPLEPGESTTAVIDTVAIAKELGNAYAGKVLQISYEAEAVQQYAAKDAILYEWGVQAQFDGDVITDIRE